MLDFLRGSSLILPESESVLGGEASVPKSVPFEARFEKKSNSVFVSGLTGDGSVFCRFRVRVDISRLSPVPLLDLDSHFHCLRKDWTGFSSLASDKRVLGMHDYPSNSGQLHFNDVSALILGSCHFFLATTANQAKMRPESVEMEPWKEKLLRRSLDDSFSDEDDDDASEDDILVHGDHSGPSNQDRRLLEEEDEREKLLTKKRNKVLIGSKKASKQTSKHARKKSIESRMEDGILNNTPLKKASRSKVRLARPLIVA